VGQNADGRLEVFRRGSDDALWHNWQRSSGGWSGWYSLGGVLTSSPAVGRNADGRLEVFAEGTDGALWHKWQVAPNSGWSGWSSLGTPPGVEIFSPNVAMNADGRLVVFVGGAINDMVTGTFWQIRQMPAGGWSGWDSLAGIGGNGVPIVATNADGRLELFEEGTDGAIWHNWQVEPSGSVWSGWNTLGQPSKGHVIAPIMGRNADGRLEVFALGPDCELWHIWQVTPGGSWSGWASLGGNVCFVGFPGSVEMNADGRLEVFSGTSSGMGINHKWQVTRGGSWSGWALLPGEDLSDPTAARNADGRLEVFAEGPGDGVSHNWQVKPGGSWSGWYTL
jgi:hypothetical protein